MCGREDGLCGKGKPRKRHAARAALAVMGVCLNASGESGPPVLLSYDAPSECPSAEYVLQRVSSLLRRQPATPTVADARITKHAGGYALDLNVDGGRRKLVSDSCESLVQTLSVILSLAVDPRARTPAVNTDEKPNVASAVEGPTSDAQPASLPPRDAVSNNSAASNTDAQVVAQPVAGPNVPAQRGSPVVSVRVVPPLRANSVTAPNRQNHSEVSRQQSKHPLEPSAHRLEPAATKIALQPSVLVWTEYGMLPQLARGPNLSVWIDRGRLSMVVTAEWLIPEWAQMPGTEARRGGYVSFLGGQIDVCWQALTSKWLGLCVGVEAGDMLGKGSGIANRRLGHGIWLAGTTEMVSRVRMASWLSADLRLGFALPVKRPAFGFDDYAWKFAPEPWSVRVASGFSWF